jgi:hypothetical protein
VPLRCKAFTPPAPILDRAARRERGWAVCASGGSQAEENGELRAAARGAKESSQAALCTSCRAAGTLSAAAEWDGHEGREQAAGVRAGATQAEARGRSSCLGCIDGPNRDTWEAGQGNPQCSTFTGSDYPGISIVLIPFWRVGWDKWDVGSGIWFFAFCGRFDCLVSIWGGFCGSVKCRKFEPRSKKITTTKTTCYDFSTQMDSITHNHSEPPAIRHLAI